MNIDPTVDEAIERLNMQDGPTRRRLLSGAGLVSVSAAAAGLISRLKMSSDPTTGTAMLVAKATTIRNATSVLPALTPLPAATSGTTDEYMSGR